MPIQLKSKLQRSLLGLAGGVVLAASFGGCSKDKAEKKGEGATKEGGTAISASAEDIAAGEKIFKVQCVSCHTIGEGKRVGPDLFDVTKRRDSAWLTKWLQDPVGMSQNDPVGKELFAEWKNIPMPDPNLDDAQIGQLLAYVADAGSKIVGTPEDKPPTPARELTDEEFAQAKDIYFNRCSGCHGTLRAGATGPTLEPKRTKEIGTEGLKALIANGTPAGMPAWQRLGILSESEVDLISHFLQHDPPDPPTHNLEDIKATWKVIVPVEDRPKEPQTKHDWQNYMGVVLRDAGQVAIIDSDTKEKVAVLDTGFAVHILRSSHTMRYFYSVGRDGKVTMIDLWPETPQIVAEVRGCLDARSVDGSKYKGYEDKYLIEGCYWPTQYVVFDGQTLEPLSVTDVKSPSIDGEELKEVRVASIVASHFDPLWVISLKESGYVGLVDYSKPGFPMTDKIAAAKFLHDGGWDKTQRYFMVAANMSNKMAIIDVKEKKLAATIDVGIKPHPGRGANWEDPEFGWVNATPHIGDTKISVYGADPENHPEHAWKVVREIPMNTAGSLFVKTHDNSPWVWIDSPLSNDDELTRQICVYSKKEAKMHKCWVPFEKGRAVHWEYNKQGTECWVSGWAPEGEIVVYDEATLEEAARIKGDWVVTPTGKFNAYNTAKDIY